MYIYIYTTTTTLIRTLGVGSNGSFLVRESESVPGDYAVALYFEGEVMSFDIYSYPRTPDMHTLAPRLYAYPLTPDMHTFLPICILSSPPLPPPLLLSLPLLFSLPLLLSLPLLFSLPSGVTLPH